MTETDFLHCVRRNQANAELLLRLRALSLDDCYLTAGCLFQTMWNQVSGRSPDWGIKDYDVFYFDDADTSWEAEDEVIRRVAAAVVDMPITVEVRNQARVHLWYPQRFGAPYPRLTGSRDGIDRYLITCTCVGIRVTDGEVYAPNGFDDLERGALRSNPLTQNPSTFQAKAESYRSRWPWLTIHE